MKHRTLILTLALGSGVIAIVGAIWFAIAGAGFYGSPFSGDFYFKATLMMVLLFGPLTVLPASIIDIFKPGRGGLLLCGLADIELAVIALNNLREWGFAIHDAALGSVCIAFPMFLIGSLLFFSGQQRSGWTLRIWRVLLAIAISVAVFYCWHVGQDGFEALVHLLRGGII